MIHEWLNNYRVFPRIGFILMALMTIDAYVWIMSVITPDDVTWFAPMVLGAAISGWFGYMKTGKK